MQYEVGVAFDFDDTLVKDTHHFFSNFAISLENEEHIAVRKALTAYLKLTADEVGYSSQGVVQWPNFEEDLELQKKIMRAVHNDHFWEEHHDLTLLREKYLIQFKFPDAKNLIEDLLEKGHVVCIASRNSLSGVIETFFERAFSNAHYKKIHFECFAAEKKEGKRQHIKNFIKHIEKEKNLNKNHPIKIVLADDNAYNGKLAELDGHTFILVSDKVPSHRYPLRHTFQRTVGSKIQKAIHERKKPAKKMINENKASLNKWGRLLNSKENSEDSPIKVKNRVPFSDTQPLLSLSAFSPESSPLPLWSFDDDNKENIPPNDQLINSSRVANNQERSNNLVITNNAAIVNNQAPTNLSLNAQPPAIIRQSAKRAINF